MSKQYILAHDLGTSGDKACLFDQDGNMLASVYETYQTWFDKEGYAEQQPEDWWEAVKKTTKQVIAQAGVAAGDVAALSFSSQSLGCIPVDREGNLLGQRVMIWMDTRAVAESEEILAAYGARRHYETTGTSFHVAQYPCSKIMWYRRHQPEVYEKAYKFMGAKEYIILKLTGKMGLTDYTEASFSGIFNIHTHQFDREILDIAGIDSQKLCEPREDTTVVGNVLPGLEADTGLTPGTKVVLGMMDNITCATGGGCMEPGTFVINLGTAGWIGVNADRPLMNPNFKSNCMYVGNGVYHTSMHSHSACASYDWVLDNMLAGYHSDHATLEGLAAQVPPGADKLFFLPSFSNGNTIYTSSDMGGAFIGMRLHHGTGNIVRAVLEGVSFDLMMGVKFYEEMGVPLTKVRIVGGGAKSDFWRQILADMLGVPIEVPQGMQHIGALGAAAVAGIGSGLFADYSVIGKLSKAQGVNTPRQKEHDQYIKLLPVFRQCYESLMPVYDRFGQF